MKSYKQRYEELLIKQHEKRYIHIPFSWKAIGRLFAFLVSLGLAIANFFLIVSLWKLLNLGDLTKKYITSFSQLLIIYPLIGEYILISITAICLIALIKGGFDKLKIIEENGLIAGVIVGLIVGLIFGLIDGLIDGVIVGLIFGVITGLIASLIFGLIVEFED